MIRRLDESSGNVLGWEVTGEVTKEEVWTLSEEFKAAVAEHGKVRVLVRMRRIPRMGLGARAEDFKLTPYARDVERYAIVSESDLFEWTSKIAEAFVGGVRVVALGAREWRFWSRFDHSWEARAETLIRIYQTVSELDFSHYAAQHTASVRPPTKALGLFACRFPATTRKKDRPKEPAEVLAEAL